MIQTFAFTLTLLFCVNAMLWAESVSLSGTVKKTGGTTGISGVKVSLAKFKNLSATSDAQGAFTLTGSTALLRQTPQQSRFHYTLAGNILVIAGAFEHNSGIVELYTGNGKKLAALPFKGNSTGVQKVTLPELSSGLSMVRILSQGETITRTVVRCGDGLYLKNDAHNAASGGNFTITKQAAAMVDTLIASKAGYKDARVPVESYNKQGIAITLDTSTCTLPNLPASSGLTTVNEKLPDPFTFYNGTKLTQKSQWECRRQEILAMAQKYVYGPCPPKPDSVWGTVSGGTVSINCRVGTKTASFSASISGSGTAICLDMGTGILPSSAKKLSVGSGNASKIQTLYGVSGMIENLATAWMVDRVMDVLELNPTSGHDPTKMMVSGCSGCGKGAFEVGVFSRIPLTVIVESGGGGVANYRMCEWFRHGAGSSKWQCADDKPQSIDNLESNGICGPWVSSVSSWLSSSPAKVKNLPYDQHLLLSCIAPRYLCSFTNQNGKDEWCHLGGTCEALSAWAAEPVWNALGIPENMGFLMYTESGAPGHCSKPASATSLANEFFKRVFNGDASAKTDVMTMNASDLQQPQSEWKAMWVDWDMNTKLQ
jgi:hypothetical protein